MKTLHSRDLLIQQDNEIRRARRGAHEERLRRIAVSIMVVIGSALALLAEGADIDPTLQPTAPTPAQPVPFTPEVTLVPQENDSWRVIAGDEGVLAPLSNRIWQGEVGEGFRSDVRTFSVETGVALGVQAFGGRQVHDLALLSLSYGHMLGNVVGTNHWYQGNWEARAEFFGGGQFSPRSDEFVGLTPHLRYNFATGTRWVPFADLGAGVTASGIGPPDQSGTFEFNVQANVGTHWFFRDNLALTFEAGFLHMSCAGLHDPNLGVNTIKGMLGLTWFF